MAAESKQSDLQKKPKFIRFPFQNKDFWKKIQTDFASNCNTANDEESFSSLLLNHANHKADSFIEFLNLKENEGVISKFKK